MIEMTLQNGLMQQGLGDWKLAVETIKNLIKSNKPTFSATLSDLRSKNILDEILSLQDARKNLNFLMGTIAHNQSDRLEEMMLSMNPEALQSALKQINSNGETILVMAIRNQQLDSLKHILSKVSDKTKDFLLQKKDIFFKTPLHHALESGKFETTQLILSLLSPHLLHRQVCELSFLSYNPLMVAAACSDTRILHLLLDRLESLKSIQEALRQQNYYERTVLTELVIQIAQTDTPITHSQSSALTRILNFFEPGTDLSSLLPDSEKELLPVLQALFKIEHKAFPIMNRFAQRINF